MKFCDKVQADTRIFARFLEGFYDNVSSTKFNPLKSMHSETYSLAILEKLCQLASLNDKETAIAVGKNSSKKEAETYARNSIRQGLSYGYKFTS
ncbi:hypothetical protein MSj_01702 [Microcystis aeruginosa Sj]|uniref:Uncharacterized protein n=1 Tax=Microcystis aeruginosa Sj TaxID=1979544 RepID=A0A2Z6UPU2_MICAE|nr:hypothetical protein MSj_01702 [Microcystis aeruginosa Sj]